MNKTVKLLWRAALLAAFPAFAAAVIVDSVPLSLESPEIESVFPISGTGGGISVPYYATPFDYGVYTILLPATLGPLPDFRPAFFPPYAEAYLEAKASKGGGYVLHAVQESGHAIIIVKARLARGRNGREALAAWGKADVFHFDPAIWQAEHKRRRIIGQLSEIDSHLIDLLGSHQGLAANSALKQFWSGRAAAGAWTQDPSELRYLSASQLDELTRASYRILSRNAGAQYPNRNIREIASWAPLMTDILLHDPHISRIRHFQMRFVCADLLARLLRARDHGGWTSDMREFLAELAANDDPRYFNSLKEAYAARVPEHDFTQQQFEVLTR